MEQGKPEKSVLIKEIPPITKEWSPKELAVLIEDMNALREASSLEGKKDSKEKVINIKEESARIYTSLKDLFTDYGAEFFEDVQKIYSKYMSSSVPLIVRKEDPLKVVELVSGKPIEITFNPEVGDKYENCALWPYGPVNATTGINNASSEGRSRVGPIALTTYYRNNPEHVSISESEDKTSKIGNVSRESVRIVSGTFMPEDLEFVVMQMASKFFPHDKMTIREQKDMDAGKEFQVFRAFKFIK